MSRLSAVVLLIVLAQVLTATVISSNEPKDVEVAGETLDAAAVVPLVQTNSLPELKKCAELGEPVSIKRCLDKKTYNNYITRIHIKF